jgi:hypothetical protein
MDLWVHVGEGAMSAGSDGTEERRVIKRRSNIERRFGERRSPDRAAAGRRVVFVEDRRSGSDRRAESGAFVSA